MLLAGIGGEVVELVDVAARDRAPASSAAQDHAVRVDGGEEVAVARGAGEDGRVEERRHRRQQVHERHRRLDALGHERAPADERDHERHAQLLVVQGRAVVGAAVLAELFAVIGGDDDERRPRERAQPVDEPGERAVDGAHLGVVALDRRRDRRQLVRLVGLVRIEVVQPEERARLAVRGGALACAPAPRR